MRRSYVQLLVFYSGAGWCCCSLGTRRHAHKTLCLRPLGRGGYVVGHSSLCAGPVVSTPSQRLSEGSENATNHNTAAGIHLRISSCWVDHRGVDSPRIGAEKIKGNLSVSRAPPPSSSRHSRRTSARKRRDLVPINRQRPSLKKNPQGTRT